MLVEAIEGSGELGALERCMTKVPVDSGRRPMKAGV